MVISIVVDVGIVATVRDLMYVWKNEQDFVKHHVLGHVLLWWDRLVIVHALAVRGLPDL